MSFATIISDVKAMFMIRAPLVIDALGYIRLICHVDIANDELKCEIKTEFATKIFAAIGEALEDGVMWVAKELDDISVDLTDAGEKVIVVGLSILGDAASKTGSVLSPATVDETLKKLQEGRIDLEKLGNTGYAVQVWAIEVGDTLKDLDDGIVDCIEDGVKEAAKHSNGLVDDVEDWFNDKASDLQSAANGVRNVVGCSSKNVENFNRGFCSSFCINVKKA